MLHFYHLNYRAVYPPSIVNIAPVENVDSSDAKNRIILAISIGSPILFKGERASKPFFKCNRIFNFFKHFIVVA